MRGAGEPSEIAPPTTEEHPENLNKRIHHLTKEQEFPKESHEHQSRKGREINPQPGAPNGSLLSICAKGRPNWYAFRRGVDTRTIQAILIENNASAAKPSVVFLAPQPRFPPEPGVFSPPTAFVLEESA